MSDNDDFKEAPRQLWGFVQKSTGRAIGKTEAYMVYFLHRRNGYEISMDEDLLVKEFSTWYQEYSGQATAESEIRTAIDNLYNQKILERFI